MKASKECYDLIRNSEGLQLTAYKCPAGRLTIGFGHTGNDVHIGMSTTKEQAELLLCQDVRKAEVEVSGMVKITLRQGQFDALVDFVFNLGSTRLFNSTLLKVINNKSDNDLVVRELKRWVYGTVNGRKVELQGLIKRRELECKLWLK